MVRLGFPKDIEDMSFSELLTAYLFLEKNSSSTSDDKTLILNQMANIGTADVDSGWVDILLHYSKHYLSEFALQIMKLQAETHYCQTCYYEWVILAEYLPKDDPFREEVIRALKGIDNQF